MKESENSNSLRKGSNMDSFFSLKGKEAFFVSGLLGVIIYFTLLGGNEDQNKFYYMLLGFGAWAIMKKVYWLWRTSQIINISKYNKLKCYEEIEKIKEHDKQRGLEIEYRVLSGY